MIFPRIRVDYFVTIKTAKSTNNKLSTPAGLAIRNVSLSQRSHKSLARFFFSCSLSNAIKLMISRQIEIKKKEIATVCLCAESVTAPIIFYYVNNILALASSYKFLALANVVEIFFNFTFIILKLILYPHQPTRVFFLCVPILSRTCNSMREIIGICLTRKKIESVRARFVESRVNFQIILKK